MDIKELKKRSFGLLIMLGIEFVVGMALNLFANLPDNHPGSTGSLNYFVRSLHSYGWAITIGGGAALFLHVLIGTGLLFGSIVLLVFAVKSHMKTWIWLSALGLFGILMAFSNGLSFLDYNHDLSSFLMAMGFLLATGSYTASLIIGNHRPIPTRKSA
jgi:hypothetical protein